MKDKKAEPDIIVNGTILTEAQAMTMRVALNGFLMELEEKGLGKDETGKSITKGYLARGREVIGYMQ